MTKLFDPFNELMKTYFPNKPLVYVLPTQRTKDEVFVKSIIQPEDYNYKVSITKFENGNTNSITDVVKTLEEAKQFVKDNS